MEFIGPLMDIAEAERIVTGQILNQRLFGHCFWPIERRLDSAFLGFCGVQLGPVDTPIEGRIEIGWHLVHDSWGQGYAREAAVASLAWGFANLPIDAIWSMTVPANTRSWGLMERLGMVRHPDLDFDHPAFPSGHELSTHITYSITREQWTAQAS